MVSYVTPKKNVEFITYIGLPDASSSTAFKANPTLASGDAKVSIDGGTLNNLTTLPTVTPASGKMVKVTLSASEMNGDNITLVMSDQTGPAEWGDVVLNIQTSARQIDDLAYPATSGRSITVDASGNANANLVNIAGSAVSTSTAQLGVNAVQAGATAWGSGAITANSIASNAFTSAKFAAGAFDAVWAVATRLLTAGTNIVLAKGTGVTGFNDLDAAGVRSAVGLATANLDTQLGTIDSNVDALPAASDNADAVLAANVEGTHTVAESLRLHNAALAGKASGLNTTTATYRDIDDSKDRIVATVDADGNRSAITLDES